ncbi:hypothetical protein BG004_002717 [Podila humilis]|nr:hypothetical protein BG004_002717 [Podila humilis]
MCQNPQPPMLCSPQRMEEIMGAVSLSKGQHKNVEDARVAVWTVAAHGHCHGIPAYNPTDIEFFDQLEARAVAATPTCFCCRQHTEIGRKGSPNDEFSTDRIIFPSVTPFASKVGALPYSHSNQKLLFELPMV